MLFTGPPQPWPPPFCPQAPARGAVGSLPPASTVATPVRTHANLALTKLAPGSSLGGGARPRGWLPGARSQPRPAERLPLPVTRASAALPTANGGQSASPPEVVCEEAHRKWHHQEATSPQGWTVFKTVPGVAGGAELNMLTRLASVHVSPASASRVLGIPSGPAVWSCAGDLGLPPRVET